MHFAIGTTNIPKTRAIEKILSLVPFSQGSTFSSHKVNSSVPDMPLTLEEIRTGAKNRAIFTRREKPDADYFVGMEGGVYKDFEGETSWLVGVVYIENKEGKGHFGYSCHLEVPERVSEGLFDGRRRELESVVEEIYGESGVGDKEGSFGLFSEDTILRSESFEQAAKAALVPHFSKFY